ncbi:hypothetical protein [Rubellimicrobium arenae]|uniref:hypothetical protein n=1 Tax=Rubellimicrobium arenae TaxID=2817372 RepID=UPI001FF0348F|nr:hypothetical protein [Rubellimicrobium arenae]
MSYRIAVAPLALLALSSAAWAQDDPQTVGVSVDGTVVEIPVEQAAQACGVDAETLLAEWNALGTEISTMADTSVQADATDLAPEVAVDTPMDAAIDGQTVTDGADATSEADGSAAQDVASDVNAVTEGATAPAAEGTPGTISDVQATAADTEPGTTPDVPADGTMDAGVEAMADSSATGDDPATADAATSREVASAGSEDEGGMPSTPTEGTTLSKSAVCEVSRDTAASLGIAVPD